MQEMQEISWGVCPPAQSIDSIFPIDCANITYPLDYNNASMGNVTAFVRRMYSTADAPTDSSVWLIAGGPGDSTLPFVQVCDYLIGVNPSYTCYTQDARGTGLSSYMSCGEHQPAGPFNPYNETSIDIYTKCIEEIIDEYGDVLQFYSTYHQAMDLLGTIQSVDAELVHIYAQSVGTYVLNTYLQLPGALADVIVLDGPVPPNRWSLENNAEWASIVAQDVLYGCVSNSSVCSDELSVMAHMPRLLMDSIVDGTLPCLEQLSWLNATDGQFWAGFYSNYCTGGPTRDTAHLCLGPFWARLHSCSASDIEQLNTFHDYMRATQFTEPDPLEYSLGVALNIGASELYSYSHTPLDYTMQKQRSSRMFAVSGVEMLIAFARNVTDLPLYEVDSSLYMNFANPVVPVLILVGTYDANTENGLGAWFQEGLGSNATLLNVPYNSHVTFAYDAPCVNDIIVQFFDSLGTSYDASCLAEIPNPDWQGASSAAQDFSEQVFGTTDLWNNEYARNVAVDNSCDTKTKSSNNCNDDGNDYEGAYHGALGAAISLGVIVVALLAYIGLVLHRKPLKPTMASQEISRIL